MNYFQEQRTCRLMHSLLKDQNLTINLYVVRPVRTFSSNIKFDKTTCFQGIQDAISISRSIKLTKIKVNDYVGQNVFFPFVLIFTQQCRIYTELAHNPSYLPRSARFCRTWLYPPSLNSSLTIHSAAASWVPLVLLLLPGSFPKALNPFPC